MQKIDGRFVYSASDLNNYLECEHLTSLDRKAADNLLRRPERAAQAELISRKGIEHERRYVEALRARYDDVVALPETVESTHTAIEAAAETTRAAMERGARIIYQGTFFDGTWFGRSDFLMRVDRPSAKWAWSYEVADTKLALHTKPYFIVQLCFYSEMIARIQGSAPEHMRVVLGDGSEQSYRVEDYSAYYRRLKRAFLARMTSLENGTYPLKVSHCAICSWAPVCAKQREDDDHLTLVASMRRDQTKRFNAHGIHTVAQLAGTNADGCPPGMNLETFVKLQRQAALQVKQRDAMAANAEHPYYYELLEPQAQLGFEQLPVPARGDLFFDMEGDPLYEPGRGLEYLFGVYAPDDETKTFHAFWARTPPQEKHAFEAFMDFVVERRRQYPDLHIYHYAPYEKTALRTLMSRHATREREVDDLLRGEVLVDLYAVVRQAIAISQPSYSIKKLEPFYGFVRSTDVKRGDDSILMFEQWREHPDRLEILEDIERYNEDDCRSTWELLKWLHRLRDEASALFGIEIPWRAPKPLKTATEEREEELAQLTDLQRRLLADLPAIETSGELAQADERIRMRWLLGHLLAYHEREAKPVWWAFFDRCENPENLIDGDKDALAGLQLRADISPHKLNPRDRNFVYAYDFPDQPHNLGTDSPYDPFTGATAGTIVALDEDSNQLLLKRAGDVDAAAQLRALIPGGPYRTREQQAALRRIARTYLEGRLDAAHPAIVDMLLARAPRLRDRDRAAVIQPNELDPAELARAVEALDESYLFIQGPPGSGKSTKGAAVITRLLADGKRVGIFANSHKAIHNLLHKIEECASDLGVRFRGLQKYTGDNEGSKYVSTLARPFIEAVDKNDAFEKEDYDLAAGTGWLFSREALAGRFDNLFIDEAGQISLADAVAVASTAKNIVLLGDPLQLAQVSQGVHPAGAGVSVLEHLLGEEPTVPPDRGIFLDASYRMHPAICEFISDAVYGGRLKPAPGTDEQYVRSAGLSGCGLRFLAIEHHSNGRASAEEAQRIVEEIRLLRSGRVKTVKDAFERGLRDSDILVVSPYNVQRKMIRRALDKAGFDVRVGTVDKFQGQEAPVVFYSMATSSGEDIPRDVDFLFEKNRINVAVSRAQCLSVLVASPRLLEVRCSSAEQIAMVNVLCRYVELAASHVTRTGL
ncbi:MAG: TM0106 family RecB-like putative nuclease [Vulcanimicrobiaceae bacterium]